jgi:hypothetical protein
LVTRKKSTEEKIRRGWMDKTKRKEKGKKKKEEREGTRGLKEEL